MELEISWGRALRVWWALAWRNLVAILAAGVIGGVLGAIIGFILGAAGVDLKTIRAISFPIGLLLGLAISVVPVKFVLGKDFGEFRLLLISKSQ